MGRKGLAEGEEGGGESGDVNRMGGFFGCNWRESILVLETDVVAGKRPAGVARIPMIAER